MNFRAALNVEAEAEIMERNGNESLQAPAEGAAQNEKPESVGDFGPWPVRFDQLLAQRPLLLVPSSSRPGFRLSTSCKLRRIPFLG